MYKKYKYSMRPETTENQRSSSSLSYQIHCVGYYSVHPHTCLKKAPMLTFLFLMSSIQGCSSIRHGVALRGGSFSRLYIDNYQISLIFSFSELREKGPYQHSIKYLKFSDHFTLSPSSFNFGIGCRTIYVRRSIRPARG